MNADKKKAKEAEARDAAPDESSENKKTKEEQEAEALKTKEAKEKQGKQEKAEKANAQAEADKHILETPEDKLNDDEKKRKAFLAKVKDKVEKDIKEKATQNKIDKRIGELTGEIKDLRKDKDSDKQKIVELEKTLTELKSEKTVDTEKDTEKKAESDRITKYTDEDKDKSREDKREMSSEELNDWLVEDYVAAQTWMTERTLRRHDEKRVYRFSQLQQKSYRKMLEKNPKLDISKAMKRMDELKKEGKTNEEVGKIVGDEYPEATHAFMIAEEHPEWQREVNAPERVAEEVAKRMKAKPPKVDDKEDKKETEEAEQKKIDEAVATELKRREEVDEGITSTRGSDRSQEPKSDFLKEQERLAKKAGISPERLKAVKERRKTIKGAEVHE